MRCTDTKREEAKYQRTIERPRHRANETQVTERAKADLGVYGGRLNDI